jgi:hypothetical protein
MTAQELSERPSTPPRSSRPNAAGCDAVAAGWRKWSHVIEADQAVRLERTDTFVDALRSAVGGKSKARSRAARRIASAPLAASRGWVLRPETG